MNPVEASLLESGWSVLSTEELLALFLRPGKSYQESIDSARQIFTRLRIPGRLASVSYTDLREMGLSHSRTLSLLAAFELGKRARRRVLPPSQSFRSSMEIYSFFRSRFQELKKECFWCLLLDGKNRILKIVRISEGSLTRSLVHPREVFRPAIREAAAALIFVHNHPSGEPQPSEEDVQMTRRLVETGSVVGIRVLDHVIIGSYRYFSFADEGMI